MWFKSDHPLSEFNQYLYLDSGDSGVANNMPIYIFRKGDFGILVEMHIPSPDFRKINTPKATIFRVDFVNDYDWKLGKKTIIFEEPTIDALNKRVAKYLGGKFNEQ